MKKILLFISVLSLLVSCKQTEVNGFTAASVKADIVAKLGGSEWRPTQSNHYYSKIVFYKEYIQVTKAGSNQQTNEAYDIPNVTGVMETLPENIILRLKTDLPTNDIYLSSDYSSMEHIYRLDRDSPAAGKIRYERVN